MEIMHKKWITAMKLQFLLGPTYRLHHMKERDVSSSHRVSHHLWLYVANLTITNL